MSKPAAGTARTASVLIMDYITGEGLPSLLWDMTYDIELTQNSKKLYDVTLAWKEVEVMENSL